MKQFPDYKTICECQYLFFLLILLETHMILLETHMFLFYEYLFWFDARYVFYRQLTKSTLVTISRYWRLVACKFWSRLVVKLKSASTSPIVV